MSKDKIFVNGVRKYICVGYSETERPLYELNPEYEKMIGKAPQNLPQADAYSLLAEVRADLQSLLLIAIDRNDGWDDEVTEKIKILINKVSEHVI